MSSHNTIDAINKSTYKLDTSGVVGILGGDNAVDALETIHLHVGRRWAGWYNYPGTITVAKRFGQMANSRLWDSLFPGPNLSPAVTFNLDGHSGPHYTGLYSGTKLTTKYLGHLIEYACKDVPDGKLALIKKDGSKGRVTGSSNTVTVISLPPKQTNRIGLSQTNVLDEPRKIKRLETNGSIPPIDLPETISVPPNGNLSIVLWAIVPSLVSIAACILCLLGDDYVCASLILLGILCSGFSSMVLGGAKLLIRVPVPSKASPPGDGVMFPEDGSIIVLKGEEADVNVITKGAFELDYMCGIFPHEKHHSVGVSSLFLMVQFLAQLLLIPRCSFFGQILYLVSFIASGVYHLFVASHERKHIHWGLLSQALEMEMEKRTLGTRTQMAVFVCLLLGQDHEGLTASKFESVLSSIIPNNTSVWKYWRRKVVKELDHFWDCAPGSSNPYFPTIQAAPEDSQDQVEYSKLIPKDLELLEDLIDDAWCVFQKYPKWRDNGDDESEHSGEKSRMLSDRISV